MSCIHLHKAMLRYTSLKFAVCAHKLTPQMPTQKNSQSHSNNSSAPVAKHLSEFDHLVGLALKGLNNAFVSTLDKRCTQHYLCLQHASLCVFFSKCSGAMNCIHFEDL